MYYLWSPGVVISFMPKSLRPYLSENAPPAISEASDFALQLKGRSWILKCQMIAEALNKIEYLKAILLSANDPQASPSDDQCRCGFNI
jgi:hypothetical protein